MKKIILLIIAVVIILILGGGVFIFAKDSPMFDVFFSEKQKEERELNRLAKLYPETIGNYTLYSWGAEKVQKRAECENVNETINKAVGNVEINGEVCNRYAVGQYRMQGSNKVVFVHIYKITKGADIMKNLLLNMLSADKMGDYFAIRPERHEIGWIAGDGVDYILTQEGTVKIESDGGQSMSYMNKATGDNPVTQYFISKYPPAELSAEELSAMCNDTDGKNYSTQGNVEGNYYNPLTKETRKQKVKDVCVGDSSFVLQDVNYYIQAGILTKEQSINKNILMEAYCSEGFVKIFVYECLNGCQNGACN
jgi:uncharacterized protein YxeA